MQCTVTTPEDRRKEMRAVHDAMDVLNGKWKIYILSSVCHYNKRRFSDILEDVQGISNKMLSKELKELETNKLIKRTVMNTHPVTVQYELTEHGMSLRTIINNLTDWGHKPAKRLPANKVFEITMQSIDISTEKIPSRFEHIPHGIQHGFKMTEVFCKM